MSDTFTDPISGIEGQSEPSAQEPHSTWFTRLSLAIDGSFSCVLIALVFAVATLPNLGLRTQTGLDIRAVLLLAAFPLASAFLVVLCSALSPQLIPFNRWKAPLNFTIPFLWFVFCVTLANLYGTDSSQIIVRPVQAQTALVWSSVWGTLPVLGIQILALTIRVAISNLAASPSTAR